MILGRTMQAVVDVGGRLVVRYLAQDLKVLGLSPVIFICLLTRRNQELRLVVWSMKSTVLKLGLSWLFLHSDF